MPCFSLKPNSQTNNLNPMDAPLPMDEPSLSNGLWQVSSNRGHGMVSPPHGLCNHQLLASSLSQKADHSGWCSLSYLEVRNSP